MSETLRLLDKTCKHLTEPYVFHCFVPNSVNIMTYRTYHVVELVGTIPTSEAL